MPHALLPLPDVYESVTRRVAVAVARQLAALMHLPEETLVYLPGNAESVPMNDGVFGNCCASHIHYPSEQRLEIRYEEDANDEVSLTTPINNYENTPIFHDEIRDLAIRPVWRYVTLNVTLTYTAPSIVIAQRWIDEMRARISMGRAEVYTPLEYHYALPRPLMALFRVIYDTMQSSEYPTGQTYEDWIMENLKVPVTEIAALDNTNKMLTVVERQPEVIGWFDFTDSPSTPERNTDGSGTYVSTMTYSLRYSRPTHVRAAIPFLVHQKPIPKELRKRSAFEMAHRDTKRVSNTRHAFARMTTHLLTTQLPYVHYPETDDWQPAKTNRDHLTFYTGLVVLEKEDLTQVVDLAELGTLSFTPFFLEYMFHQGDKLFKLGSSIFQFKLYENNTWLRTHTLKLQPGTTRVVSDRPLDPTRYYHIQISFVRNWVTLDPKVTECLRRYPTVLYNALVALGVKLKGGPANLPFVGGTRQRVDSECCPGEGFSLCTGKHPELDWSHEGGEVCPMVIRSGVVSNEFIRDAVKDLDRVKDRASNIGNIEMRTVMFLNILTFKK